MLADLHQRGRRHGSVVSGVVALMSLTACTVSDIDFRVDRRLTITAPSQRETVALPVTISWQIEDFAVTGPDGTSSADAGYFAVFVDREPQPPGKPIDWLARNDPSCRADDGCPDVAWFTEHHVHLVEATELTLARLPNVGYVDGDEPERHEITIALLDGSGRRIGETAFNRMFFVDRERGR